LGTGVKALEDDEDALAVPWRNGNAVVPDAYRPGRADPLRENFNAGYLFAAEFNGVANQVLKKLSELNFVGHNDGKRRALYAGATLLDGGAEIFQRAIEHDVAPNGPQRFGLGADPGKSEEIINEGLHDCAGEQQEAEADGLADDMMRSFPRRFVKSTPASRMISKRSSSAFMVAISVQIASTWSLPDPLETAA
jgi:hypothetical protein